MSKPIVVTLCGSTRFREEYEAVTRTEALAGRIVISVGLFGHQEAMDMGGTVKAMLDELHLRKIDLCSEIMVVNPLVRVCPKCQSIWRHDHVRIEVCSCHTDLRDVEPVGYVGSSTRREIAYAREHGKTIRSLNPLE